jgi:hypothetical protein
VAADYTEEMALFLLANDGAYTFEEIVPVVQDRLLTERATEQQVFDAMERLRRNGHIASAGTTDVRGNAIDSPHWHITGQGRQRFLALQMPNGTQGFAEAVAGVPLAGPLMVAGSSASRWLQRKALAKPANRAKRTNRAKRGTSTD